MTEEPVTLHDIAETIGAGLAASDYFGSFATLAMSDLPASAALTPRQMGWRLAGPDLLTDLRTLD